jgi:hypothetical protein
MEELSLFACPRFLYGINETDFINIVHWLKFQFKNYVKFNFDSHRSNAIHILYEIKKTKYKFFSVHYRREL